MCYYTGEAASIERTFLVNSNGILVLGLKFARLSQLSGRALPAQASYPLVQYLTTVKLFHFSLFSPYNIQCEARFSPYNI